MSKPAATAPVRVYVQIGNGEKHELLKFEATFALADRGDGDIGIDWSPSIAQQFREGFARAFSAAHLEEDDES